MSSEEFLNTTWTLRVRKIIGQQINKQQLTEITPNTNDCVIEGDQTQLVNLFTEMASLKDKIANLEESTVDAETKRELKRIKNQIATIRAEGFAIPVGATYIPGMSYEDGNKPAIEVYAQGYGGENHGEVQNELKGVLKDWFKGQEEDLQLTPEEPIQEVDSGFADTIKDPAKCHEPIYDKKTKSWIQCDKYKVGDSVYCHKHQKKSEKRDKALAQWK